ncbi:hypothetical protein ACKKBF_B01230 [Auxenochlorella protothecoides x Auxenochlorella symbiontica]
MLVLGAGKGQRNTGPSALTTPLGNAKAAAAGTVMEAQELGEQVRWLDDALYSLDGLRIRDASVQSASLLSLLELSARPATLAVMKQHGLLPLILETAGTWQFTASPTLKICAALFWAHYCAAVSPPGPGTFALFTRILQESADLGPSGEPGALVSLERLASAPHSSASRLPSSLRRDAPALLLQALTERVEDQNDAAAALAWKEGLRCQGGFGIVAQTMLLCVGALTDTSPSEDTVRCLWTLHRSLVLFEAATFACPENAGEACAMQVTSRCTLLAWLVQMVATLASQGLRLGLKKDCMRCAISVLVNLSQNSQAGCEQLLGCGAVGTVLDLITLVVQDGGLDEGLAKDNWDLETWLDELCGCLGLLVNIAEHGPDFRAQLRACASSEDIHAAHAHSGVLQCVLELLKRLHGSTASEPAAPVEISCAPAPEFTSSAPGAKDLIVMYASILLGFVVMDDSSLRQHAEEILSDPGLRRPIQSIRLALRFYSGTGALMQENEQNLTALLQSLEAEP